MRGSEVAPIKKEKKLTVLIDGVLPYNGAGEALDVT
jgi:hypothetical protein